jgi:hypothetical protein
MGTWPLEASSHSNKVRSKIDLSSTNIDDIDCVKIDELYQFKENLYYIDDIDCGM